MHARTGEQQTVLNIFGDFFCPLCNSTELHQKPLITSNCVCCVCNELKKCFPVVLELLQDNFIDRQLDRKVLPVLNKHLNVAKMILQLHFSLC